MSLNISQIRRDGGTQSRAAINEATVADYAEAMADPNTVFPPVIVYHDGKDYWLADGFHRLAAWERIGRTDIPTEIRQGDRRRAILHSLAANSAHGLRRTNDDKRRAVMTLLDDAEWGTWSTAEIARRCAVSQALVREIRDGYHREREDGFARTVERGGTVYQQNTSKIGRKPAEEITGKPHEVAGLPAEPAPEGIAPPPAYPAPEQGPAEVKARRDLAKLTREALEDDVIALRAALADEKAGRKKAIAERDDLKQKLADHTADDKDEVIRRLTASLKNAENAKWRATEEQGRLQREIYVLKKRVAELESMGIAL